uniref:Secreted protein n=1 Tax=Panstrongylus lignarius TaxID=156445 RepID=A0A224Y2Z1_9HEMI
MCLSFLVNFFFFISFRFSSSHHSAGDFLSSFYCGSFHLSLFFFTYVPHFYFCIFYNCHSIGFFYFFSFSYFFLFINFLSIFN